MTTITLAEEIKLENPKEVLTIEEFLGILRKNGYNLDEYKKRNENLDFMFTPYEKLTPQQQKEYDAVDLIDDNKLYNI